jgi:hypothetical protein
MTGRNPFRVGPTELGSLGTTPSPRVAEYRNPGLWDETPSGLLVRQEIETAKCPNSSDKPQVVFRSSFSEASTNGTLPDIAFLRSLAASVLDLVAVFRAIQPLLFPACASAP